MIFYATKEALQRYKLKTSEQVPEPLRPFVKAVVEKEGAILCMNGDANYSILTGENVCSLFILRRAL